MERTARLTCDVGAWDRIPVSIDIDGHPYRGLIDCGRLAV
jgi:hypothetical protein